jgi:hypothetical protein
MTLSKPYTRMPTDKSDDGTLYTWFPLWDDIGKVIDDVLASDTEDEKHFKRTTTVILRNNSMNPVLEIRTSNIKNMAVRFPWGVFAKVSVEEGTVIVEYKGDRITNAERLRRYGNVQHSSGRGRYVFDNNDETFTDAENPLLSGIARYINATGPGEESEANVEVRCRDGKLYIECIKYIHPRTELLFDYGIDYKWGKNEHKKTVSVLIPRKKNTIS